MEITVELDNIGRVETGRKEVAVTVPQGATARDLLRALVEALPKLGETTIDAAKGDFYDDEHWLVREDGRGIPDLSQPLDLPDGARLLIVTGVC